MAGKMWCCGGSGSGGGLAAVATADTPTVDLTGDGTAGAPISATVLVAPEPNGVEAGASGLLVAPSAQAGNVLTIGTDGRLYVPTPAGGAATVVQGDGTTTSVTGSGTAADPYVVHSTASGTPTVVQAGTNVTVTGTGTAGDPYIVSATDPTTVTGIAGSSPAPVDPAGARSVDVDVTPNGSGGFQVGARLSPVWGQLPGATVVGTDLTLPMANTNPVPPSSFTVPEAGVYEVSYEADGNFTEAVATTQDRTAYLNSILLVNGTGVASDTIFRETRTGLTVPWMISGGSTATIVRRLQLAAGDTVAAAMTYYTQSSATAPDGSHAFASVFAYLGYHKISD